MAIDLLCELTFEPDSDPEDVSNRAASWWQTLIYDLDPEEERLAKQVAQEFVADLETREARVPLSGNDAQRLSVLRQFISGELS
jgi:hypothetical protein